MLQAQTIDEVIHHLDNIIADSIKKNSRLGYFASLYRRMTIAVQQGINNRFFDDGARMASLDTRFANRYLEAWFLYTNKKTCSRSWQNAFDFCNNNSLVVIQHLLIGINTHINLDLGIAAAETSPGDKIHALQKDFDRINDVIASTSQQVQDCLARIWFPLKALERIANNREDAVINFSIGAARRASWANALALSVVKGGARDNYIGIIDDSVVRIAARIANPGLAMRLLLRPVKAMEPTSVAKVIGMMSE